MVLAWFGVNESVIRKAEDIAGQRYVILLTDMYAAAIRPKDAAGAHNAISPLCSLTVP
ncbi:dienelactone hydrolase family protein (plasmid) [Komagataeibacter nataicola]|uniref:dienelactone hydrolase family protein n=1 Tax=Komagataeibacter TaxID=1434011 RepID=UPI0020B7D4C5|nr:MULTISPECIES: dienelactone hydrolase family protein [Komagataeibacter]WEQ57470.1 dienelactone hydrolase family protein [Komagataeibacter nataicola]